MPIHLSPGVFIEEIPGGSKPIDGVSTSITAFVGPSARGPAGVANHITGFQDYEKNYGGVLSENDEMGLALQAFYLNGGGAAYVCRLAGDHSGSAHFDVHGQGMAGESPTTRAVLRISANSVGDWGNDVYFKIVKAEPDSLTFGLLVGHLKEGEFEVDEAFDKLNMVAGDSDYALNRVNTESTRVQLSLGDAAIPTLVQAQGAASVIPVQMLGVSGLETGVQLEGGIYNPPTAGDYRNFYGAVLQQLRDVSIIVLPGQFWAADGSGNPVISETLAHCESTGNRVLIIDPPRGQELGQAAEVSGLGLPASSYSVLYYPWVSVANPFYHAQRSPDRAKNLSVAPSALAAGLWAKTDSRRGVWKAPAGVRAQLNGVSGLAHHVADHEQDQLNPLGINCIRKLPRLGTVVWGSRTLASRADPEWRYVPVRRTAIFIEQSILNGIQWAVFEPNDQKLWSSLRANIGSFMNGLFRNGAFQGSSAKDAYFVRCGLGDTMTQWDIDAGRVLVVLGFAALKPAEFVIIRIQQRVDPQ